LKRCTRLSSFRMSHPNGLVCCRSKGCAHSPRLCDSCMQTSNHHVSPSLSDSTGWLCAGTTESEDENSVCSIHTHKAPFCSRRGGSVSSRRRSRDLSRRRRRHQRIGGCQQRADVAASHVTAQFVVAIHRQQSGEAADSVLLQELLGLVSLQASKLDTRHGRRLVKGGHHVLAVSTPRCVHHQDSWTLRQKSVRFLRRLQLEHICGTHGQGLLGRGNQARRIRRLHKVLHERRCRRSRRGLGEGKEQRQQGNHKNRNQNPREVHLLELAIEVAQTIERNK